MKEEQRFYVRILSPVHLGCDEVYEPPGFVVDEDSAELIAFDPLDFYRTLSPADKDRFAGICGKGTIASLLELNKFMQGKKAQGLRRAVCRGFVAHYRKNLGLRPGDERIIQNELNRFTIHRTAFHNHTGEPYIPGSAIKGALRTAYLNAVAQVERNVHYEDPKRSRGAAQQFERGLLHYRDLQQDPFRLLKVSDFVAASAKTAILYAVNEKKKASKYDARGPYQILETIEPGSWFVGTISVDTRYTREAGIGRPLTREAVLQHAHGFYVHEKSREENELKAAALPPYPLAWDGSVSLRIGRHSGAESLTIEGHRQIKIMQGKGKPPLNLPGATTFWLASDEAKNWDESKLRPFGWAAMGILSADMAAVVDQNEKERAARPHRIPSLPAAAVHAGAEAAVPAVPKSGPVREHWQGAVVSWNPGSQITTAVYEGKKATGKGKELLPAGLHKALFEKHKTVKAPVTVERVGNAFTVIHIEGS